jgi:predicted ATPase/DNA-binding winged helix-turn-helix (wHTH) protein/tetratricopeptide (TPR) repeat protein
LAAAETTHTRPPLPERHACDTAAVVIRFADVTIDVDGHEVSRAGKPVDVQPQVLDVLVYLIRHRERVISKEELLDAVWNHRFVTESALTSRIKSARQVIGDNGRDQQMIRTVHGRGYRFVAAIDADGDRTDRSPVAVRRRLPVQTTPFVGRRDELRRIAELLGSAECRLLTITAPGGMGKTRLAVEAAERSADVYADGVYFAPFAGVSDADQMVYVVAEVLGLSLDARAVPRTQLIGYLAPREVLLVLDNLEHLPSLDLIAGILSAAPGVAVLATSRERLNLQAEWVFELGGLGLSGAGTEVEGSDDALDLFVRSARQVRYDFTVDEVTEREIRRICRLVGGMPLALELAAGWAEVLSVDEIAAEIERGLEFLASDLRDIPDRQRSIETVFDTTWDRLTAEERDAFTKLSVFRGGFTRAAATAIAGAGLPMLRRLNNKSMIATTDDTRYTVHELVRQYGERKLASSPSDVRRAHSDHFLTWMADQAASLRGELQAGAVRDIAADMDNVRAAWIDAVADGRIEMLERAVESLWLYLDTRGSVAEMGVFIRAASAALEPAGTPGSDEPTHAALSGMLCAGQGLVEAHRGALEDGRAVLERGLTRLQRCAGDPQHVSKLALIHLWLGWVNFLLARNNEADEHAERGLTIFTDLDDRWGIARCQILRGNNETAVGQLKRAVEPLRCSRAAADAIGDRRIGSLACRNLAILAGWFGDYRAAAALLDEALGLSEELGDWLGVAYALREIGKVQIAEGRYTEAVGALRQSIAITDGLENRWESAATADDLGNAYATLGEFDAAEEALTSCLHTARANRYYTARAIGDLGALAFRRGDVAGAEPLLVDALARWKQIGHEPYIAWVLVQLGRVAAGDTARQGEARRCYAESLELTVRHELAPFAAEALVNAADLEHFAGVEEREALLRLAGRHPATTFEVRQRAQAMSSAFAGTGPDPASRSTPHARNDELWETAARVGRRLARHGADRR